MFPIRTIIALGVLAGTACIAHGRELRSSDIFAADFPTVQAVAYMDKLVRERTGGKHSITRLGQSDGDLSENYTIAELQNGTLDMARVNLAVLGRLVPSATVPALPYLFKSTADMRRVLDGPIGDRILADMESHGLIGLCFYDMGARSYAATKPIRHVRDMKGLKVRVQQGDIGRPCCGPWRRSPRRYRYPEPQEALQAGTIDAAETTLPAYVALRHHEAARFYSPTEHSMAPGVLVFSKRVSDTLSQGDQRVIRTAARESVPYMRKLWEERETSARQQAKASGAEIVGDVDRKSFADALTALYPVLLDDPTLRDMVRRIQAGEPPAKGQALLSHRIHSGHQHAAPLLRRATTHIKLSRKAGRRSDDGVSVMTEFRGGTSCVRQQRP